MATASRTDGVVKGHSRTSAKRRGGDERAGRVERVIKTAAVAKDAGNGHTRMDGIAAVKNVPLFSNIPQKELKTIRAMMHECAFDPGRIIIREGERGDSFHVVTSGTVEFTTKDADGREIVLDKVEAGGFFGELSMLTGDPRSAGVRAASAVTTLSLDRRGFQSFLMENPRAGIDMLTVVARRLSRADALLRQTLHRQTMDGQQMPGVA